jgi:hypothetical protein
VSLSASARNEQLAKSLLRRFARQLNDLILQTGPDFWKEHAFNEFIAFCPGG